jgi:hypothetical protein
MNMKDNIKREKNEKTITVNLKNSDGKKHFKLC